MCCLLPLQLWYPLVLLHALHASVVPPLGHSADPIFALLVVCWLLLSNANHCSWFVADIWPPLRRSLQR